MNKDKIQELALDAITGLHRAGVGMSMGTGKTLTGLKHMSLQNKTDRFLVVAPSIAILDSWKEEAVNWNFSEILKRITFTTYLSLNKLSPQEFDCVYLDECHAIKQKHEQFLSGYS